MLIYRYKTFNVVYCVFAYNKNYVCSGVCHYAVYVVTIRIIARCVVMILGVMIRSDTFDTSSLILMAYCVSISDISRLSCHMHDIQTILKWWNKLIVRIL